MSIHQDDQPIEFGCERNSRMRNDPSYVVIQADNTTQPFRYVMSNQYKTDGCPRTDLVRSGCRQYRVGAANVNQETELRATPSSLLRIRRPAVAGWTNAGFMAHSRSSGQLCLESMMRPPCPGRKGRTNAEFTWPYQRFTNHFLSSTRVEPFEFRGGRNTQAELQNSIACQYAKNGRMHT